jgi:coenzyme F420-0:L-glutamate ligase / coenzyme F420-1:gamma-L-glutamate ligase
MSDRVTVETVPNIPPIEPGQEIGDVLLTAIESAGATLAENDIICVASKIVSIAERRQISLEDVEAGDVATSIHQRVPRKDPRTIQLMIDETGKPDGSRLEISGSYIAGWMPNGLYLTSAGIDKVDAESVILLPEDADKSAKHIGQRILEATGINVGIIITDSDGREDKKGATQLAVGVYGVPPLRVTEYTSAEGKTQTTEETLCDMLAASAALIMGQRGTNKPSVIIRGVDYTFDPTVTIRDALNELR